MECESMLFVKNHITYLWDLSNSFSYGFIDFYSCEVVSWSEMRKKEALSFDCFVSIMAVAFKLWIYFIFLVIMRRHHIRKLKITFSSEVSVPSDKRPYRTLTFHNVLAREGSSFCNRARLNFQAFALRDTKVAA